MSGSNVGVDAIPSRYLKEIPITPTRSSGNLQRTLDDLSNENAHLNDQLFAERHNSLTIKCDLERERERALELEQQLKHAIADKVECLAQLKRSDDDTKAWLGHRALLAKACEDLQTKTTAMEEHWRAKEKRWSESAAGYEQKIRDLVDRLTEANRQLRVGAGAGSSYHKRALEDAQEQIRLLKRRLRSDQLGKVRDSVSVAETSTISSDGMEVLSLKRDNVRLTAKVRALEDQLVEKNTELSGFRDQLGEVQTLLRDNLERQNQAAHETKSFGAAMQELHGKMEAQQQEIAEYQARIARVEGSLETERASTAELRSQLQQTELDRDRYAAQVVSLQTTRDELRHELESAKDMKKAIVEIAAERDDFQQRLQKVQSSNADLVQQLDASQTENGKLRCELRSLIDTVSNHERKLAAQTTWYHTWKKDIDSVSSDLRLEADRLKQLRRQESAEIQRLKLRLAETEDALKEALAKNSRMDSVLERVISSC